MNIVSYDQRKNYSEKVKLRNIDLDRGKVQSTFYTLVAPHIVDSDPSPPWKLTQMGEKQLKTHYRLRLETIANQIRNEGFTV